MKYNISKRLKKWLWQSKPLRIVPEGEPKWVAQRYKESIFGV
jgi:hypothetical protein